MRLVSLPRLVFSAIALLLASGCASTGKSSRSSGSASPSTQRGIASWYGEDYRGKTTANGEKFNPDALTAAHRTLPFGTKVSVKNMNNNRSVVVRINDRGPFVQGRIIDLSKRAARDLDMVKAGLAPVEVRTLPSR